MKLGPITVKWLTQRYASPGYVLVDFRVHRSGWFYFQINNLVIRSS